MAVGDLIVFGVDAADFDVINSPELDLPTLEGLMEDGATADLESTLPPITGAAWPSMACGRDPNAIEMFEFANFSRERKEEYRPSPDKVDPFWSYLSEAGYRCGISGYPLAPLDKPVDGFVLSWPWYEPDDAQVLAPEGFFDDSGIDVGDYIRPNTEFEFDQVMQDLADKIRFDERVLEEFDFDVYYTYLDADTIIHMTSLDDKSGLHAIYEAIDEGIERLLEHCGDDCSVLVVSDHGVSEMWGAFHMNNFLIDRGHLSLQSGGTDGRVNRTVHRVATNASQAVKRLGLADAFRKIVPRETRSDVLGKAREFGLDEVDWAETDVAMSGNWGQLYVFDEENRDSIREQVVEEIRAVADEQGMEVDDRYPADEYVGDIHPDAPDVVATLRKDGQLVLPNSQLLRDVETEADYFQGRPGGRMDQGEVGVFIAAGPEIEPAEIDEQFHLTDVAPTVLNHLEGTIPPSIHGAVRRSFYRPDAEPSEEPETGFRELQEQLIGGGDESRDGVAEVKEKLSDLGYFE